MDKSKVKIKKRAAAGAAILSAAAVAVASRGQPAPPSPNAAADIPPAIVYTLPEEPAPRAMPSLSVDEETVRTERRRAVVSKIMRAVYSALCFILPLILSFFTKAATAAVTPLLAPVAAAIVAVAGEAAGIFLILTATLSLLFRLTFPGRSLKEFFTFKNLASMAAASVVIALVMRIETSRVDEQLLSAVKLGASALAGVVCTANVLGRDAEVKSAD